MTQDQEYRYKCEVEIIQKLGRVPSSRELVKELKKYGINISHTQANQDLKLDLSSMTTDEYEAQKEGIVSMISRLIDIAQSIATTDANNNTRLKAMNTVSKLSKTKADILSQFRKVEAKTDTKPTYNVFIGKPKEADIKKLEKLEMKNDEKTEAENLG